MLENCRIELQKIAEEKHKVLNILSFTTVMGYIHRYLWLYVVPGP